MVSRSSWERKNRGAHQHHHHRSFFTLPSHAPLFLEEASIYDVRKIFGFMDPSPLVTVTNQLILFLSSAFWGPNSLPPTADVIYGSPLRRRDARSEKRTTTRIAKKPLFLSPFSAGFRTAMAKLWQRWVEGFAVRPCLSDAVTRWR